MKKVIFLFLFIFLLTGCFFNPYHDSKFGEDSVDAWFNYKKDDLGETRKKIENIKEIKDRKCEYLEDDGSNYIFKCNITYQPVGETVIPLSKNKTLNVFAVFTPHLNGTYTYRVYNSNSKSGIWLSDDNLNYGK